MKQNKRLNRRIIISSFMLIIICSVFSSQSTHTIQNSVFFKESAQLPASSAFTGTGKNFQITQHATAVSSTYDVNPTTTASFTLTNGWTAENISITTENTSIYRNLIQNGVFDDTIGHSDPVPDWDWYNDTSYLSTDNRTGFLSIDVAETDLGDGTGGDLYAGDTAYFYQSASIDEEHDPNQVVEFSFDSRLYSTARSDTYFYAAVIIGGVEYNYTREMSTMTTFQWYYTTLTYYLEDEGQSLPDDITFRLGTYVDNTVLWSTYNSKTDQHFDNVEYNIWNYVDEPYALVAEDTDTTTDYYYTNTSAGQGSFTIDVQKSYGSTQDVEFSITKNASIWQSVNIDNLTITADLIRTINSSFSSFQDGAFPGSDDILWMFDAAPSIPVSYTNKWVEIEKPSDWLIVSAVDPFLTNQTSSCTDLGYGTTKIVIPTDVFSSGDWQIRARSISWFDDAKLEYWNGASFEERTEFYVNEDFHVKVDINDTVTFTNTNITFTIYYPNGTTYYNISEEVSSTEYYFGNFTIGINNMSVGTYTAEAAWTNNLSTGYVDKVGYKTFEFDVLHHTSFTAINPLIETVPGEALLILVTYEDTDLNQGIDLAAVEYNSTFGQSGSLQYAGGGYYFLDLDTSALDYTDYN
ncbi:MAG: hypothetical protein ACTSRE_09985, partial [Promethearchaeota archaeon]